MQLDIALDASSSHPQDLLDLDRGQDCGPARGRGRARDRGIPSSPLQSSRTMERSQPSSHRGDTGPGKPGKPGAHHARLALSPEPRSPRGRRTAEASEHIPGSLRPASTPLSTSAPVGKHGGILKSGTSSSSSSSWDTGWSAVADGILLKCAQSAPTKGNDRASQTARWADIAAETNNTMSKLDPFCIMRGKRECHMRYKLLLSKRRLIG